MSIESVNIGDRAVGPSEPTYVAAEIGINHNGDLETARKLIDAAADAGCDAVKFQKRSSHLSVPAHIRDLPRDTPWGTMSYLEYRERLEFGSREYAAISQRCELRGIPWFASCWDEEALDFIAELDPPCFKIASATLTDHDLLRQHRQYGKPIILSTGMSTIEQIDEAVEVLGSNDLVLLHCTSTYPAQPAELNLRAIETLAERYQVPVGYSGHEVGLAPSLVASAIGACMIERHITLDRAMWGSDQAASVEPHGIARLVRDIRTTEASMGDAVKRVYESELPILEKLRRVP